MQLTFIDYSILTIYFFALFGLGIRSMLRAGKSSSEFFLSGRSMPWWLLGFSMVATTFAADTPNLVTNMVRENGVAGNWLWWAFLLTGMTTVFIYAGLWRRLGLMTDIEFYEIRYSGKSAAFLRGFRTIYIGLIGNVIIMATVTLAIIKILNILIGSDPFTTVVFAGLITTIYAMLGGLVAVIWADFALFILAMTGSVVAACYVLYLPEVNGLSGLLSHPNVVDKMSFFPDFTNFDLVVILLVIPLLVQWWSVWYPGAEPGGGSFIAQRMLSAKSESHAIGATLFFNFCHYAVRPWPWIIVAFASLIIFPDLASLREKFPNLPDHMMKHDMAYPAMLTYLPSGWAGLVLASLFAAYMSTVATLSNLGSAYMVNDFYHRFVNPKASEKQLVFAGRLWTVLLMIIASALALQLSSALDSFEILLQIGAGTGLLFLLRWFWWRINAWSEISAMAIAFPTALYFKLWHFPLMNVMFPEGIPNALNFSSSMQLVIGVTVTTIGWVIVTLLTPPDDEKKLREFLRKSRAGGPGWKNVIEKAKTEGDSLGFDEGYKWPVPFGIFCSLIGCVSVYCALFATGLFLYGRFYEGCTLSVISVVSAIVLFVSWKKIAGEN
ncbi:MAG: Na+:solute symporter [Planctomycetaceae bacterium]|nr:Na+:solute symporter [Planctomycetaceae bacterium]